MKQTLQLKLGQQLAMTPQLQQAIRLLQLSTMELQTEIQQALDANPMLEIEEETPDSVSINNKHPDNEPTSNGQTTSNNDDANTNTNEDLQANDNLDYNYEEHFASASSSNRDDHQRDFLDYQSDQSTTLRDHLLEQIHLSKLTETDRLIASTIIDAIDEDGYLTETLESILAGLHKEEPEIELEELEALLHLIQHLDPTGVGARNPKECLLLQLQQCDPPVSGLTDAITLVSDHLDALATHDYVRIKRQLNLQDDALQTALDLILSLNPRPGAQITSGQTQYIVPDVLVHKKNGRWYVDLNPEIAPRLRINPTYAGMIRRADKSDDNNFLKNHLQEARWFIKSLQSRNQTLLNVAQAIVQRQRGFLEYGEEAMKPMVLRDIADQLDMHESTISRVTTQKYMHTPKGIFEFKYFFSSHVATADGGECSATAIRAMIRKLIGEENAQKPLSDSKIASLLIEKGINVARRTVAKYREAMLIPPSNERKRFSS